MVRPTEIRVLKFSDEEFRAVIETDAESRPRVQLNASSDIQREILHWISEGENPGERFWQLIVAGWRALFATRKNG